MARKLDLHESATFSCHSPVLGIMGFEDAESSRPIPVCGNRRFRVDESTPTAGH